MGRVAELTSDLVVISVLLGASVLLVGEIDRDPQTSIGQLLHVQRVRNDMVLVGQVRVKGRGQLFANVIPLNSMQTHCTLLRYFFLDSVA